MVVFVEMQPGSSVAALARFEEEDKRLLYADIKCPSRRVRRTPHSDCDDVEVGTEQLIARGHAAPSETDGEPSNHANAAPS